MKKIIGGVLIIMCLSQPSYILKNAKAYSELLHIQQFYVKVITDEIKKRDSVHVGEKEQQVQSLIYALHNNSRQIAKLLEDKKCMISTVQEMMNEKAKRKQRMTTEQIEAFTTFTKQVESENVKIHTALLQVNDLRDMKEVQQQILMEEMNYDLIQDKINQIVDYQSEAIVSLQQVLEYGDHTASVLA